MQAAGETILPHIEYRYNIHDNFNIAELFHKNRVINLCNVLYEVVRRVIRVVRLEKTDEKLSSPI